MTPDNAVSLNINLIERMLLQVRHGYLYFLCRAQIQLKVTLITIVFTGQIALAGSHHMFKIKYRAP